MTDLVVAAVHSKVASGRDASDEGEESVEDVQHQRQDRVDHELVLDRDGDEVEQRQHREHRDEHVVVDDRRSARSCDHVADERHCEQDHEELVCAVSTCKYCLGRAVRQTWKPRRPMLMIDISAVLLLAWRDRR